tara:strand:+ start:13323 stop:13649 length:327 start_codon:yes stop_codon:yes gene_type:complete
MAVTVDSRPSYFGDRLIVTGSYTGGSASETIDLTSLFSRIDAFILNPDSEAAQPVDASNADGGAGDNQNINLLDVGVLDAARTTLTVRQASDQAPVSPGTFLAIGRRS